MSAIRTLPTLAAAVVVGIGAAVPAGAAPGAEVPPVSPQAAAAGFVDVRTVVPDAVVDLRYATPNNFVGVPLYPADARCLVHNSMAPGLAKAADDLRAQGDVLVFWDCYRPHDVQVRMFDAVPNPAWVAKPGPYARSHEAGRSVDVTIAERGRLVDMGTDFDDFSPRAQAYATDGVSAAAQANRERLRAAMGAGGQERSDPGDGTGGLTVYSGEWWHFDGPGAGVQRPILDVPVN
ncbi:M15 family metallopeptidase [Mycolicibacterium aichiense]|uniref:M15 family metallopeptidase n=1 Tax=Mycolicibacterium aichiense TaxID=1799 RepID=UPI003D66A27C